MADKRTRQDGFRSLAWSPMKAGSFVDCPTGAEWVVDERIAWQQGDDAVFPGSPDATDGNIAAAGCSPEQ